MPCILYKLLRPPMSDLLSHHSCSYFSCNYKVSPSSLSFYYPSLFSRHSDPFLKGMKQLTLWLFSAFDETRLSHELLHPNWCALCKNSALTKKGSGQKYCPTCSSCQKVAGAGPPQRVNAWELGPNQIWQTDVTPVPHSSLLSYVHVSLYTYSKMIHRTTQLKQPLRLFLTAITALLTLISLNKWREIMALHILLPVFRLFASNEVFPTQQVSLTIPKVKHLLKQLTKP